VQQREAPTKRGAPGALFYRGMPAECALLPHPRGLVTLVRSSQNNDYQDGGEMKNPLDSLWGTVISGLVLTLILYNVVKFALQ
jgi:hypothetical protein